jgi:hypothetical protein
LPLRQVYIFGICVKRRIFFIPDMTYFEKKIVTLQFRPQSADCTSLNELQRARKHFQTLVVFRNTVQYVTFWCQMMILIRFFHILITIDGGCIQYPDHVGGTMSTNLSRIPIER